MTAQGELIFHDSVGLPLEQLEKGRKKAVRQQDKILALFKAYPVWFTPYEIQKWYEDWYHEPILITSVRRSITNLTMSDGNGQLRKGDYGDQVKERWGTNNNRWKYNSEYVKPINPKR